MIIALTGTPGTGKTSVCNVLSTHYHIIDLNNLIISDKLHFGKDEKRDSYTADIEKLEQRVEQIVKKTPQGIDFIMDGHLSHLLPADVIIVLRTDPVELKRRLCKRKKYSSEKIRENVEAEALDVILVEAVERCNDVYEINTTCKDPEEVTGSVIHIINSLSSGKIPEEFLPGKLNWLDKLDTV